MVILFSQHWHEKPPVFPIKWQAVKDIYIQFETNSFLCILRKPKGKLGPQWTRQFVVEITYKYTTQWSSDLTNSGSGKRYSDPRNPQEQYRPWLFLSWIELGGCDSGLINCRVPQSHREADSHTRTLTRQSSDLVWN